MTIPEKALGVKLSWVIQSLNQSREYVCGVGGGTGVSFGTPGPVACTLSEAMDSPEI